MIGSINDPRAQLLHIVTCRTPNATSSISRRANRTRVPCSCDRHQRLFWQLLIDWCSHSGPCVSVSELPAFLELRLAALMLKRAH